MTARQFRAALTRKMRVSHRNDHRNNWDWMIRGPEPEPPQPTPTIGMLVADLGSALQARRAIRPVLIDLLRTAVPTLRYRAMSRAFKGAGFLHDLLEDRCSKDLLVEICAFRALGHRKVKLKRNTPDYWKGVEVVRGLEADDHIRIPFRHFNIDHFELACRDFTPLGHDLRAYCTTFGGSIIFIQKQYELHRDGVVCKAESGDTVIEAGACWGDTALYFANQVGPTGRVLAFEIIPSNIDIFRKNLDANPRLKSRIDLVDQPLWRRSGKSVHFIDRGPASRLVSKPRQADPSISTVRTIAIDDLVADRGLARLDFIKMDIEGAELDALKGAEKAIRRFQPKLAISIYHSFADFRRIPRFIASLDLPYRFYLDHHTIFDNETVLFAVPEDRQMPR